jgi:hypothetical protein
MEQRLIASIDTAKQSFSELLPMKTRVKEHYGKKMTMLDAIYDISQARSSVNPVMLVQ